MAKKTLKTCSFSIAIGEMEIKITLGLHLIPIKVVKINDTNASSCS